MALSALFLTGMLAASNPDLFCLPAWFNLLLQTGYDRGKLVMDILENFSFGVSKPGLTKIHKV
jgi:hypothetical protein